MIKFPSRTACDLNRPFTMKLVLGISFASSSIQKGWRRLPTDSSANFSSELAKPVQVFSLDKEPGGGQLGLQQYTSILLISTEDHWECVLCLIPKVHLNRGA